MASPVAMSAMACMRSNLCPYQIDRESSVYRLGVAHLTHSDSHDSPLWLIGWDLSLPPCLCFDAIRLQWTAWPPECLHEFSSLSLAVSFLQHSAARVSIVLHIQNQVPWTNPLD